MSHVSVGQWIGLWNAPFKRLILCKICQKAIKQIYAKNLHSSLEICKYVASHIVEKI